MTTTEDRIAWLEQKLRVTTGELVQANDRIEALEAALREIVEERDGCVSPGFKAKASAALAGKQEP